MIDGPVGWVYEPVTDHKCILPKPDGHYLGAIWRCGGCGDAYKLVKRTHRNLAELAFEPIEHFERDRQRLDDRLYKATATPVIHVGPDHPIRAYPGWGDPAPGFYRGALVIEDLDGADLRIQEISNRQRVQSPAH